LSQRLHVVGCLLLSSAACLPAAVNADPSSGRIYSALSVVSDYRYNGVSLSNNRPALQGYAHWQQAHGYYAGVFATGVDFRDPSNTSYEVDVYTGRKLAVKHGEMSFELLYSSFPEKDFAGPTYDFLQLKSQWRTTFGRTSLGVQGAWTPQASFGSGTAQRIAADARRALTPWLNGSGAVGRRWIERGTDRTYWDLGLTLVRQRLALDPNYDAVRQRRQAEWAL
jgi:uncharacterized protein (TIGR02001 family)